MKENGGWCHRRGWFVVYQTTWEEDALLSFTLYTVAPRHGTSSSSLAVETGSLLVCHGKALNEARLDANTSSCCSLANVGNCSLKLTDLGG